MDAVEWDARYAGRDLVWGAEPNRFVADELGALPPGRALDLACGEGRNAIWLARQGWDVIGVDFSAAGLDRATRLATDAGVADHVRFVLGDVVAGPLPGGPFDVVVVAYLQLPPVPRRAALRLAAEKLAPGGTLLVIAHDSTNLADGVGGPRDPAVLYTPQDVLADLAGLPDLAVVVAERRLRPVATEAGDRSAIDAVVRIRHV